MTLAQFEVQGAVMSGAQLPIERRSASTIPETLSITYYEPSRDYQQGVQRARRDGGARRDAKIELPVVLAPEAAKQIAEAQLDCWPREKRPRDDREAQNTRCLP